MPSPIGHVIAGVCGFVVLRNRFPHHSKSALLLGSIGIALMPDLDVVPGILIAGDPTMFHHRFMHSLAAAVMAGLMMAGASRRFGIEPIFCGLWTTVLYGSHVMLDMLVDDPSFPRGEQLLWPLSEGYFIAPITPLPHFDYFDPASGIIESLFSSHNTLAIMQETALLSPLLLIAWHWAKKNPGSQSGRFYRCGSRYNGALKQLE